MFPRPQRVVAATGFIFCVYRSDSADYGMGQTFVFVRLRSRVVMASWHTRFVQRAKEEIMFWVSKTETEKVIFAIKAIFHCSLSRTLPCIKASAAILQSLHISTDSALSISSNAGFSPWQDGKTKPEEPYGNWFWSRASADMIKASGLAFSWKRDDLWICGV